MQSRKETEDFGFSWKDNNFSTIFWFRNLDDAYAYGRRKLDEFNVHEIHFHAFVANQKHNKNRLRITCTSLVCDFWYE